MVSSNPKSCLKTITMPERSKPSKVDKDESKLSSTSHKTTFREHFNPTPTPAPTVNTGNAAATAYVDRAATFEVDVFLMTEPGREELGACSQGASLFTVPIYPNIRHVQNHPKECHRYQCKPFRHDPRSVPSVFGRNLQCQPVRRVNTREECHWSHACSL